MFRKNIEGGYTPAVAITVSTFYVILEWFWLPFIIKDL